MLDVKNIKIPDFSFVKKRWFIITAASILAVLLIGFIWAMSVRGDMLNKAVAKVQKKLKDDYALNFEVQKYEFAGLTTVDFQQVKLIPDSAEQLAAIDEFKVSVKLFPLLSGTVQLDELDLKNADITLVKHDSTANYDFLFLRIIDVLFSGFNIPRCKAVLTGPCEDLGFILIEDVKFRLRIKWLSNWFSRAGIKEVGFTTFALNKYPFSFVEY